ncbi:hypothetical protein GUJ93_ZPchr0007g3952 [Zizania palustris]|uniref:non-specific serine/threonine protein kinase n=1 Tax=Zizania palustris TaxID=103762 RepID=A0A8J5TE87_ZIZPA|nr:hypothetical protein GUJ93_ZPchr0007g3952 [Zizania palustris]
MGEGGTDEAKAGCDGGGRSWGGAARAVSDAWATDAPPAGALPTLLSHHRAVALPRPMAGPVDASPATRPPFVVRAAPRHGLLPAMPPCASQCSASLYLHYWMSSSSMRRNLGEDREELGPSPLTSSATVAPLQLVRPTVFRPFRRPYRRGAPLPSSPQRSAAHPRPTPSRASTGAATLRRLSPPDATPPHRLLPPIVEGSRLPAARFISIDCGLADGAGYRDDATNIMYTSDGQYIDRGSNAKIAASHQKATLLRQLGTVRTFPDGERSCYTLQPVVAGDKYLIRATFLYGNYDGLQSAQAGGKPLRFDLYLGANLWRHVNVLDEGHEYRFEAVHVAVSDFLWLCLVNIGEGTPFISALELRPINNTLYPYALKNQTNSLLYLYNYGPTTDEVIRYPDDPFDRIWVPYPYNTVLAFLQWLPETNTPSPPSYLHVLHPIELVSLTGNASRWYNFTRNGKYAYGPDKPDYQFDNYWYNHIGVQLDHYDYVFVQTENATLPPLINAAEIYSILELPTPMTDGVQAKAIVDIKGSYGVKRNWMGDPCSPKKYAWEGLSCSSTSANPTIISINLSSSGLKGQISDSFSAFGALKYLDLSCNGLTGRVPDFLAEIQSLMVLNLSWNNITGPIPVALIKKSNSGFLTLSVDCYDGTCVTPPVPPINKHNQTPIIIGASVAAVVALLIIILALFYIARLRVTRNNHTLEQRLPPYDAKEDVQPQPPVCPELRAFTYTQLKNITANFTRVIGRGGFGVVYLGHLEDGNEVAVKVCSQISYHGSKQFLTEAKSLSQVHHRNLVFLVGYCNDGDNLGLVYEYMTQGSLHDHLRGKTGIARILNWELRLKIALDATQGLDYLHTGCMMVHRDVKSSNILIDQNLHGKIADFGLVKIFGNDAQMSLVSTISGTPGYIDPEYQSTSTLSDKSDVYSFGVVLLEVVTGEPPIMNDQSRSHITDFVSQKLAKGALENIVDPRLQGDYDPNSMWKVIDLAVKCTARDSAQRPAMADVVTILKGCLAFESARALGKGRSTGTTEISDVSASQLVVVSGGVLHVAPSSGAWRAPRQGLISGVIYFVIALCMAILWSYCLLVFVLLAATDRVHVHSDPTTQGFISIDCGLEDGASYRDDVTNIMYTSDGQYIDRGSNAEIEASYKKATLPRQLGTVRTFPEGERSCYTLQPVVAGSKYLIRTTFLYGNYDGLQSTQAGGKPLLFDLYLGANLWQKVNVSDAGHEYRFEAVHVAVADFIWLCLVNIGEGMPFISTLELRPLNNTLYPYALNNQTNSQLYLYNYGPTNDEVIRYPDDPFDRIWVPYPYNTSVWTELTTTAPIEYGDENYFWAPRRVLQTAVTPLNSRVLAFLQSLPASYFIVLHPIELVSLTGNDSRWFNVTKNGKYLHGPVKPSYQLDSYLYSINSNLGANQVDHYDYALVQTENATLPPLINAAEVYSILELPTPMTDGVQAKAIMNIKGTYGVKGNWMGDPCSPKKYAWEGLSCSSTSANPTIISINLSSSGLKGQISDSFSAFRELKYLDLSCNGLTGRVPDFLAEIQSLLVLNLSWNNITGPIPDALLKKANSGFLTLSVDCYNSTCGPPPVPTKHNQAPIIIGASVAAVVALLIIILALFYIARLRVTRNNHTLEQRLPPYDAKEDVQPQPPVCPELRAFTYTQLKNITANFTRVIGRGGFGVVYLGHLEDGNEVAVKVCSQISYHGSKQFLTEAKSLSQVHHRNLVFLVGYCNDSDNLALVYEYMAQGSLHDHLRGKTGIARILNWELRLKIALDAAQGLDYLHTGCMMVHRDVKSSNILIDQNLHGKIADFGLVKIFGNDAQMSFVSTISGTPGYIDPEYQSTSTLSDKSDVYSFGVVLLEVVTGEPPVTNDQSRSHITDFVSQKLAKGALENIVDPRLQGDYDPNSMWKVIDVAVKCTARDSAQRPAMADVVIVLKGCLAFESSRAQGKRLTTEISDVSVSQVSVEPAPLSVSFGPSAR